MPRHMQPRKVAELKGATKKNPQRYRTPEAKSEHSLGQPPNHLSESAQIVWAEIEKYSPDGVLTGADRLTLEVACELMAEFRERPREIPAAKIGRLQGALASLGLNPSDRQKIGAPSREDSNPYAAIDAQ